MKKRFFKRVFASFIILIFVIPSFVTPLAILSLNELIKTPDIDSIKTGGSWIISPVFIEDDNPARDWDYFSSHFP